MSAFAISVNITVFNIMGATGNGTFKVDTVSPPTVSWINYPLTETQRANAGVVALNSSGQIVVQVAQGGGQVDFIVDLNGYFPSTTATNPLTAGESFAIVGSFSGGGVVSGTNSSTAAGSAGLAGNETGASGTVYGVLGQISNTILDSAGVRGVDGSGAPTGATSFGPAGVRGESTGMFGVLGISQQGAGVTGVAVNTTGSTIADGRLGYSTGGTNYGVFAATGDVGATGTKSFVMPHPSDPEKVIRYISLEGNEVGTYTRGRGKLKNHQVVISIPDDFRLVTEDEGLSVQLTPIGRSTELWIQDLTLDRLVVRSSHDIEFFYTINGIRKGYLDFQPVVAGSEFMPASASARMPESFNPETKRRLIANGTYNEDGTVNMVTAERLGWAKVWASRVPDLKQAGR